MARLHAPTDLDTVADFCNTMHVDEGTDELREPEGLAAWLVAAELVPAPAHVDEAELALARDLREVLRTLAHANHEGTTAADASRRLSDLATRLALQVRFTDDGDVELVAGGDAVPAALATIVAATAAAMADDRWRRFKLCGADDCLWAFYDESRNRSARWCSMAACGNREKARKFRQRHDGGGATG